jgi:flagellar protein FlaG
VLSGKKGKYFFKKRTTEVDSESGSAFSNIKKESSMEAKLRQVQPAMVESWMRQDHGSIDPLIQPAVNLEIQVVKAFGPVKAAPARNAGGRDPGETQKALDGKMLKEVQSYLDSLNIQLSFSVHYETGDTVVQVIDSRSGEVIRQIPSDELLHLKEKMNELRGILFDQKG